MKDAEDMTMIGSVIDKQQKILQDCTEKKISLVKLQSALLKQTGGAVGGGSTPESFGKMELSVEDKKMLQELIDETDDIKKDDEDKGETYSTK